MRLFAHPRCVPAGPLQDQMLGLLEQHGYPTESLRIMARGELARLKHTGAAGAEVVTRFDGIDIAVHIAQERA